MRMRVLFYSLSAVIMLLQVTIADTDDYRIDWCSVNVAGTTWTSECSVPASVGQVASGIGNNGSTLAWVGFWAGDIAQPTHTDCTAGCKQLSDSTFVGTQGVVSAIFSDCFYLEDKSRASGIRINPIGALPFLQVGSQVSVIGTLQTTADGERSVSVSVITASEL